MLEATSYFQNNALYIIDGLGVGDMQTAKRLYEDMQHVMDTNSQYCKYFKVGSPTELLRALDRIKQDCEGGIKPILHFEIHGDSDVGLNFSQGEETLKWDLFVEALRSINIATKNNTGVVMAVCYGLHAIQNVSILKPSPFFFLIGSETILDAGEIEKELREFYNKIFHQDSLSVAMESMSEKFKQFHSEKYFMIAISKYFRKQCMGKGKSARIENLLTTAIKENKIQNNRHSRKLLRKNAKNFTKPNKKDFDRFANAFLHGRVHVSFEEIISFVKGSAKRSKPINLIN